TKALAVVEPFYGAFCQLSSPPSYNKICTGQKKKNRQESKLLILAIPSVLKPIVQETETKKFRLLNKILNSYTKVKSPDAFFWENPENRNYLPDKSTRFNRKINLCKGS
ncbi:MAG: hypothetical protein O7G87_20590, partial [bacterium]|nr:hypothetical protein [bacterium]